VRNNDITIIMCFSTGVFLKKKKKKKPVTVAFSNFSGVLWTKNILCVFRVKPSFSNFSIVMWTRPHKIATWKKCSKEGLQRTCTVCHRYCLRISFKDIDWTFFFFLQITIKVFECSKLSCWTEKPVQYDIVDTWLIKVICIFFYCQINIILVVCPKYAVKLLYMSTLGVIYY